ncbi:hypothetical protein C7I84_03900 [Mesorhizobium ephedrae]|uniref:Propionyl-coenzyme A carboxylase alpha polypeptide n=1 Tax=Kumtagia ephedrae TaxID=2116701 RepID=A0A2P7SQR3_9HYPH|nr:hypothetical protein C7I84_03900 [Mesorhizobium ephedrae]
MQNRRPRSGRPISPLVGEMSGRTEGGNVEHRRFHKPHAPYPRSARCWMNTAATIRPALTTSAAASGTPLASSV